MKASRLDVAAKMREAALKSSIFVGVPRVSPSVLLPDFRFRNIARTRRFPAEETGRVRKQSDVFLCLIDDLEPGSYA